MSIWFMSGYRQGLVASLEEGGQLIWSPLDEGAVLPEPTLRLPPDLFKALIEESTDFLPPSAATDRHLEDAIKVRDRLLTLVETK